MEAAATGRNEPADMAVAAVDHLVTRDQVVWGFGPELEPVLEVEPRSVVRFETNDFLSVACDVGVCQACQPSPFSAIARVVVPKIDACPLPFG